MTSFDDPTVPPPADITGADARAYEEKILELLRHALLPRRDPIRRIESIELRGKQPDTLVVICYTDTRESGPRAVGIDLWRDDDKHGGLLADPMSMAGWIYADWLAGDLDPIELENP